MLTTKVVAAAPAGYQTPLLALLVAEGSLPESIRAVDQQTGGAIGRLFASRDFRGKVDETAVLYPDGPAARVVLVGVGKAGSERNPIRRAAAVAAKRARVAGVERMAIAITAEATSLGVGDQAQALAEGLVQGAWFHDALKQPPPQEDQRPRLTSGDLLFAAATALAQAGHRTGEAIAAAHAMARDIQVLPGNVCTPAYLADTATALGARHGFQVTVLDREAIIAEGMGALLAVAQGSALEPRFIVLEYKGNGGAPVVLIGKGITFDSGGISIKPADRMEDMKFDMSGAAAVLGTFEMLGRLTPKSHVIGLIPSCENMPSGTSYKPGDVVKAHSGKTIEVVNTDAEGRLILADALSWARRYKPACVLDAATLTGAVVIALGHSAAGIMGTDVALLNEVREAAEKSGERVWELPLWDDYRDLIKSDIADMKNSGGRAAGTITGAWFLREFAEGYPWVHCDIAGTAYTDRETAFMVKGPTGAPARLFAEFVLARG
jgi:leucyl aminopeptidase